MLSKLGKYEVRRELGRGAMGIVYEGYDPFIERVVAIKTINKSVIDPAEADAVFSRFRREAQAAGRLTHPAIVSIYEYGEDGDVLFIAMERVEGIELQEFLNNGRKFELGEIARIMYQLLDALNYSHQSGVVHRDIKPANILIAKNGNIKIADFGIAKIEATHLTTAGFVLGTPAYMSPEQYIGHAVDGRSDIYSAGVVLYQLLTGARPFAGSNLTEIMQKVMHHMPVLPSTSNPVLANRAMDEVINRAMAKHAEHRYQTAAEFLSALKQAVAMSAVTAKPAPGNNMANQPQHAVPQAEVDLGKVVAFDQREFEQRLQEVKLEFEDEIRRSVIYREPEQVLDVQLNFNLPEAGKKVAPAKHKMELKEPLPASGLLASLAQEAKTSLQGREQQDQDRQEKNRLVHEALERILQFFIPFVQHVNAMQPDISRVYRLDARAVYDKLKWKDALVNSRKKSLSDAAQYAYVTLLINLAAPEPIRIKRPWEQFEALKRELQHLQIRPLDDLEELYKKPKQEWLETRLENVLPVQIAFQGNYESGQLDVSTRNLADFGQATVRLAAKDVSAALLDELGLFLIGRKDTPPALFRPKAA